MLEQEDKILDGGSSSDKRGDKGVQGWVQPGKGGSGIWSTISFGLLRMWADLPEYSGLH